MSDEKLFQKQMQLNQAFKPTQPISELQLFAGRLAEIERIMRAILEPGRHVILYGERGVGKTSLANIIDQMLGEAVLATRVTANSSDSFSTIWRNLMRQVVRSSSSPGAGFVGEEVKKEVSLEAMLPREDLLPNDVLQAAALIDQPCIFIVDEFDRVQSVKTRRLFADAIKAFSDNLEHPTLILVGVAKDVSGLIGEHASIERNVTQVELPRMSQTELREIVLKGLDIVEMTMNEEVIDRIVLLSQGFPHYTHLLAKGACLCALRSEKLNVARPDLGEAIIQAVKETEASIQDAYIKATASSKPTALFSSVLLACALVPLDEGLSFRATDIRDYLEKITNKPCPPQTFTYHLGKFCDPERGAILEKIGMENRRRYRFRHPLLRTFVILKAHSEESMPDDLLEKLLLGGEIN